MAHLETNLAAQEKTMNSDDETLEVKRETLQKRLGDLLEEYQAAYSQLSYTLDEVEQVRIKRQINRIDRAIEETRRELGDLTPEIVPREEKVQLLREYLGHTYHVNNISLKNDEAVLVSCSGDLRAIVWQVATGEAIAILKHRKWVGAAGFIPGTYQLATTDGSGALNLWDWQTNELVNSVTAHNGPSRALAITSKGDAIITGGYDGKIKFWRLPHLEPTLTLEEHKGEIRRLALSPDNQQLVSVGDDGMVFLWSWHKGKGERLLNETNTIWRSAAFSGDGSSFAITNGAGVVLLWSVANGLASWRVQAHQGAAIGVCFHPYGGVLVTSGQDKLIRLWDANRGQLVETIAGHQDVVTCVAFDRSGNRLFSGSRDTTIRLWRIKI